MPTRLSEFVQITWSPESHYDHKINKRNAVFYRKAIVGKYIVCQGDFVLINNADHSHEVDENKKCEVAKILHMYENVEPLSEEDPCHAIVEWYTRPSQLQKFSSIHRDFKLDDNEVVLDTRPFLADVSLETIFKLCKVDLIADDAAAISRSISTKARKSKMPFYICRYKLVKETTGYTLVPVLGEIRSDTGVPSRSSQKRSQLAAIEPQLVSPIKITKYGVEKLSRDPAADTSDTENITPEDKNKNHCSSQKPTPNNQKARRNLNESFNSDVECLNYSIVKDAGKGDLNICLRVSQRHGIPNIQPGFDYSPLTQRRSKNAADSESSTPDKPPAVAVENTPSGRIRARRASTIRQSIATPTMTTPRSHRRNTINVAVEPSPVALKQPRRSILKTPNKPTAMDTPKRRITLSNIVENLEPTTAMDVGRTPTRSCRKNKKPGYYDEYEPPSSSERSTTVAKVTTTPSTSRSRLSRTNNLTPSLHSRQQPITGRRSMLEMARERLHVSTVVTSLPCRENEFANIFRFIEGKLLDKSGGCMYISGVPGTGKTATVTQAIRALKKCADNDEVPDFDYIDINGMRLTEPRQAYVQIYKQMTGKTLAWEQAHDLLEHRFSQPGPKRLTTVLLVDELDILCNRRQDVVYNLLDWPTKAHARLVVVTIANTMDLPERLMMGKVASRLGLTRLTFSPYNHKQLQEIVTNRLLGTDAFDSDALQLVARKVASVSGDARRALDICRRATEIAEAADKSGRHQLVTMAHVQKAVEEMIASVKVKMIQSFSMLEKLFLKAVAAEVARTGIEETTFLGIYSQFEAIAAVSGVAVPSPTRTLKLCNNLGSCRLLICEHSRNDINMKILLNVSVDDIHYALQAYV